MPGALLQLSARGNQDRFLNIKPQMSLFKTQYKRHSGFAVQTIEQSFNSTNFGERSVCNLLKDADLISGIKLRIVLPSLNIKSMINSSACCTKDVDITCFCDKCMAPKTDCVFGWTNSIGHVMTEDYSFHVGSKEIDRRSGEWMEWWSEFAQTSEKKSGYWEMIGKREPGTFTPKTLSDSMELIIPLDFYFTGKSSCAFPICAIGDDNLTVEVKWRHFNECWVSSDPDATPSFVPPFKASLLIDYVYLDQPEHFKFKNENHLYLIEQVHQNCVSHFGHNARDVMVDLNYAQPTKAVYWAIQRADVRKKSLKKDSDFTYGNDIYNYSCYKSRHKSSIKDTFNEASISLDGQDRTGTFSAKYYRLAQSYDYHTKTPSNFIYMYSFAISPEDHQPSGTCNFSMFNKIKLKLKMSKSYPTDFNVHSYSLAYNWLIIKNHRVSLAFTV